MTHLYRIIRPNFPILILLLVNLIVGLLTFRNYGLSWDEPLFYDYADSIQLAYTPQAFSPDFDFEQVYGPSATDHKYYGPAYLLAARPVQQAVMALLRADRASAWHLVNFLDFQVGLLFFFLLLRRWFDPWPAAATTAFFAWQPVLWGHAFINPKDVPFMVFFLIAVTLGFWMVDGLSDWKEKTFEPQRTQRTQRDTKGTLKSAILHALRGDSFRSWGLTLIAGIALGAAVAVRVIGPLAGLVVCAYFLLKIFHFPLRNTQYAIPITYYVFRIFLPLLAYILLSLLTALALWPFLWADPFNRVLEVLAHMSYNPTELAVLFMGQIYRAATLPHRYFPQMLALTLTEPTWILFAIGLALAIYKVVWKKETRYLSAFVVLGWFVLMLGYVLLKKPPMYDGFRHFLFTVPPVFAIIGFAFQFLFERIYAIRFTHYVLRNTQHAIRNTPYALRLTLYLTIVSCLLLPSLLAISQLHPYEYTYYNTFTGGVGGAYRVYETDYWLTCYKESLEWLRANQPGRTVHIQREFPLAAYYGQGMALKDLGLESETEIRPGDLLLFSTRADLDIRSIYRKLPVIHTIGRAGADFCLIKQKPEEK